ncbi:Uu.00g118870.m01.CDS01 [Anthostomella pinea]|uniref:NCT transcriptional regulatory complex subunit B n=1 Tax=Anthostomella pinea TaxID=933095 RepID=A0AAI8VGF4_9PEZI|nr:Uu.00g118870.m01.CDS01 [Anthostomella pinea]
MHHQPAPRTPFPFFFGHLPTRASTLKPVPHSKARAQTTTSDSYELPEWRDPRLQAFGPPLMALVWQPSTQPHSQVLGLAYLSPYFEQFTNDLYFAGSEDLSLPKATVQKIVSEILPASTGVSFSKEARDLLIECCVEFITLVSSEANEISEKEAKKTIACDHITKALDTLGFGDYVSAVLEAAQHHKETQKVREKRGNKFEDSGMTMEELASLQMEFLSAARDKQTGGPA